MFSKFKSFVSHNNEQNSSQTKDSIDNYKSAISQMDSRTADKIHKGVDYNSILLWFIVKFCIRGPRQSGKTSLFRRLEGNLLKAGYEQTPEIRVGHAHWNSEVSNETVKV